MKSLILMLFLGALLIGCNDQVQQKKDYPTTAKDNTPKQNPKSTQIAILGTFHFGATNDYSSVQIDSLQSNKRQKELDQLVAKIKQYNPTKIMVEWEPSTKVELDSNFAKYMNGNFKLPRNEIYQIGFRLAKANGITEFFPVDYQLNLGDEKLVKFLQKEKQFSKFENLIAEINEVATKETAYLKSHTLTAFFKKMNSEESGHYNKNIYLEKLAKFSNQPGNPALEYAANWYKRNIFIMGLIDEKTQKNDRILLIIGAGHKPILKDLYKDRSNMEYVEIQKYLN